MSLDDDVLLFFNTEVECEETLYFAGVQYFDLPIARFPPIDFNEDFSVPFEFVRVREDELRVDIGLDIVSSGKVVLEEESCFSDKGLGKKFRIDLIGLDKMLKIVLVCLLIDDQGWNMGNNVKVEKI